MGQGDSFEVLSKNSYISNEPPKEQSAVKKKCCGGGCCGKKKVVQKSAFAKGDKYGSKNSIGDDSSSMLSDASSSKKDADQEIQPSSDQKMSSGQRDATKGENSENYDKIGMIQWETRTESGMMIT